jgi:RimJ/RimL family protein N-acetyltransferase
METRMAFHRSGRWVPLICLLGLRVVGTSNYIDCDKTQGVLEIGGTLLDPDVRGTGYNGTLKHLMIERAFASGYTRVEFRVDTRNTRSMAAVAKLGAVHEGTLRRNKTTWTGYRRDTAIYGLLKDEWRSTAG